MAYSSYAMTNLVQEGPLKTEKEIWIRVKWIFLLILFWVVEEGVFPMTKDKVGIF